MAKSKRAFLREELSKRFIPYLRSRGFERVADSAKEDGRSTFPFGTLIRKEGTASDIIEIQFDKYSRPKFIINFRKEPPEVIKFGYGTGNLKWAEAFRLHPRPKSISWFTVRTFFGLRSAETCAKEVVDRLMSLFSEVESWFKDRTIGEHLRLNPYPVLPGVLGPKNQMKKEFRLKAIDIKPLAIGRGSCIATDMITVEGRKVGFMYREPASRAEDTGWRFMSGIESQAYMDNADNLALYDVNTIANYDSDIIPFLDAPVGSAFERGNASGPFTPVEFSPADD